MTRLSGRLERLQKQVSRVSDDVLSVEVRRVSQLFDMPYEDVLEEALLIRKKTESGEWPSPDFNDVEDVARSIGITDPAYFPDIRDDLHRLGYTNAA